MEKMRIALIILSILLCSLSLFACSEPDIDLNRTSDVSSSTTAETTIPETTSAAAMVQKEKTPEKETTSVQSTYQITQADMETEETDGYADYDDPCNEEDYYQSEYEESEQEYEQNDDWEDNDYDNYEHEHSFYRHGIMYPTAHSDGAIVYDCDCGESYTEPIPCTGEEPHSPFSDYMELIDNYTTIESTPVGERVKYTSVYQCTICGHIEEIFYMND